MKLEEHQLLWPGEGRGNKLAQIAEYSLGIPLRGIGYAAIAGIDYAPEPFKRSFRFIPDGIVPRLKGQPSPHVRASAASGCGGEVVMPRKPVAAPGLGDPCDGPAFAGLCENDCLALSEHAMPVAEEFGGTLVGLAHLASSPGLLDDRGKVYRVNRHGLGCFTDRPIATGRTHIGVLDSMNVCPVAARRRE